MQRASQRRGLVRPRTNRAPEVCIIPLECLAISNKSNWWKLTATDPGTCFPSGFSSHPQKLGYSQTECRGQRPAQPHPTLYTCFWHSQQLRPSNVGFFEVALQVHPYTMGIPPLDGPICWFLPCHLLLPGTFKHQVPHYQLIPRDLFPFGHMTLPWDWHSGDTESI